MTHNEIMRHNESSMNHYDSYGEKGVGIRCWVGCLHDPGPVFSSFTNEFVN